MSLVSTSLFKRRSLRFAIGMSFVVGFTAWTVGSFYYDSLASAELVRARKRELMIDHSQTAYLLLEVDKVDHATERLRQAKNSNELYAYRLEREGKVVAGIDRAEVIDRLPSSRHGEPVHGDDFSYLRTEVGPYDLIVVVNDSVRGRMAAVMEVALPLLLRDLVICLLLTIWIVTYFLEDIRRILRSFSNRRSPVISPEESRSEEGRTLAKGLTVMHGSIATLSTRNRLLEDHVLPALRGELASGRTPPYEFDCTLVRVDINDFSRIFNSHPREEFMETIDEFFETVSHVVDRYGGYVYQFIGDEVVFYFKDVESPNSAMTAIASLRDICNEAERLDREVHSKSGYHFRVKGSASRGQLRFGKQVTGHSLAGSVLIDTVRILALVEEKDCNVVLFDETVTSNLSSSVEHRMTEKDIVLKGSANARTISRYVSFASVSSIVSDPLRANEIAFHRSDEDLAAILDHLASPQLSRDHFLAVCAEIRKMKSHRTGLGLARRYRALLDSMEDTVKLASVLALARHLLTANLFEAELRGSFKTRLFHADRRVVANAVEAFSFFESVAEDRDLARLMLDEDNRIAANALVREGMRSLSGDVLKRIRRMLRSENPLDVASALYALGELAAHHREKNPLYAETHSDFEQVMGLTATFLRHHDPMIRRQAIAATRKAGLDRDARVA